MTTGSLHADAGGAPAPWLPKSVIALRHYSVDTFRRDVAAGVTVGLVALPLAMAFAIASGLTPQAGLYCAVVTGFTISALGGSRVQIGGPTGAFVVVVAGIVARYGVSGLYLCTMMAGVLLRAAGPHANGQRRSLHPAPGRRGFHKRHCRAHREHADPRRTRPSNDRESRRLPRTHGGDRPASRHHRGAGGGHRRDHARDSSSQPTA